MIHLYFYTSLPPAAAAAAAAAVGRPNVSTFARYLPLLQEDSTESGMDSACTGNQTIESLCFDLNGLECLCATPLVEVTVSCISQSRSCTVSELW